VATLIRAQSSGRRRGIGFYFALPKTRAPIFCSRRDNGARDGAVHTGDRRVGADCVLHLSRRAYRPTGNAVQEIGRRLACSSIGSGRVEVDNILKPYILPRAIERSRCLALS